MTTASTTAERLTDIADDVGMSLWVHARRITDTLDEVCLESDAPVPMASLYKVPLAAAWAERVAAGELDPEGLITLDGDDTRTAGPTGVSVLQDRLVLSQRDCVRLALALSDNASAAAVLALVGHEHVQSWLTRAGCTATHARRGTADVMRTVVTETGGRSLADALRLLADPAADRSTSEYDPALTSSSTARDLTTMLSHIWGEERAEPVRAGMRLQAWRHRIGSGLPHDDVTVAAKSGTLGRLRHEMAVVEFPGEVPIALAVLTRSLRPEIHQPRVDAAIGAIARAVVHPLRRAAPEDLREISARSPQGL